MLKRYRIQMSHVLRIIRGNNRLLIPAKLLACVQCAIAIDRVTHYCNKNEKKDLI